MKKSNFLTKKLSSSLDNGSGMTRKRLGNESMKSRKSLDSILSRFSFVSLICLFILTLGVGNVWADKTDVITASDLAATTNSYTAFSNLSKTSDAKYAGKTALGNSVIQMNSSSPNGIISTTSGGIVKSVTIVWENHTSTGRTINIYGKNSAYSASSELWNNSNQGVKLGSVSYDGSNATTTLQVYGDFQYIGLRSSSNALYVSSISITWTTPSNPTTFSLVTNASDLSAGDKIIILNTGGTYALSTTQNSNNRAGVAAAANNWSINGNVVTLGASSTVQVITIGASSSYKTLVTNTGYLYASGTGTSYYLKTQSAIDTNGEWTISISSGEATITEHGSNANNTIRFNSPNFGGYASSAQTAVKIYKESYCTELGSINGSINMSSSTDGTVTISGWSDVSNASSYTVKLYKWNGSAWAIANASSTTGGSSGTAATRTAIATDSKSVTYSGLEYGGTYKFTVTAIGTGSYCDGPETAVTSINGNSLTDNKFLNKYSIYIDDATNDNYAHNYITSISSHAGSVDITLEANKDYYQYKLSLGGVVWWGNTGKMTSANCTSWTFTNGVSNCKLQTNLGGTYTFALAAGTPAISVTYPPDDQASGKNIYFDNSVLEWSNIFYRVGSGSTNVKEDFTLVAGTDNFYYTTTPEKNDISAWHIANNTGWTGSNDIYKTKTGDDYAITKSIAFQQYVVTGHITIIPTTTSSKGSEDKNNNCDFYTINTPTSGMLTHTATITTPSHGTITISNTDQSLSATSTTANLPHRTILTITATPDDGYSLSSLTVNAAAFTSGSTHILAADATIAATFTANKYDVTLKPTSQTGSVTDQVVQATYDAAMPTTVKTAGTAIVIPERTGYSFTGWFDNSSGGKQYYQYTGSPKTLSSANAWDKTSATNLYAQWSINSYTLTWSWGGGSTSATSGDDYTAAGSVEYNAALTYPADNTMSRNGYTFDGWSSDATNMPAENLTITAQWEAKQYTVTLDNKSATTAGTESVTATFGQLIPDITPPTKTGYRFDGYWTEASGGTKYINADGTGATPYAKYGAGTHKLHAHWVAQITFSVNGAIDGTLTRDVTASLPSSATVPTSCGDCWAFAGWDESSTCSTTPGHAGGENAATHGITTPTTLYAVFSKAEYKLIKSTSDLVANDNYVLTIVNSGSEYAMSNEAQASYEYEIARTDVTSSLRENADGYFLYNVSANNIWKFTGTSSSGQLYNAAAEKYLNLSSNAGYSASMLNTTDNLTFSVDGIYWTIHGTKYLHPYSVYGGGWEAVASGSWDADEDFSAFLYHQTSAMYATEPSCETYDIVWKVDGTPLATGSQTEETNTCAGIEELPEDPDDDALDCATKFMGWSEEELVGVGHDAPADLFTTVGDAPAIDEDKTFHAVFATVIGTPIAAVEDNTFTSSDESGSYCSATYSFKAANKYLQKQSIWTSSNMTNVKVKIRVYHISNSKADVLRVSLINSSGEEVVGADLSTSHFGSNISGGGYSDYVELTPTTAVTGYKVSMKTLNSSGTGISKIEREVVASGLKDYVTMCCDYIVTLSDGSPSNGSVTFDPAGPIETCTAAKEVSMTITPDAGYYLSAWTSSGVTPASVSPAITTNNANAQTTTVTFAKETTEGTYTAGATFSAKALEGWTWMYKKDADAADGSVDPYAIPDVVEIYKDQYARFIITGYTPADVIAAKQGYVYSAGGVEPYYSTDYLTYVSKNGSAPYSYYQLKGKAAVESTTITFKAVGDASITKTITIRVKALPLAHFVDNVHNESFADVVATVSTGVVTLTKQTPTHADFTGSALNTCEETHLHLIGWIDGDWAPYAAYMAGTGDKPTISAITGATGYFYAPGADIDLVAKDGKTYYAVWANVE